MQPLEVRLREDKKNISIAFSAGEIYEYSAELLRVESPSAEVAGHGKGQKTIVAGKKNICIKTIEPVGNYALKFIFSDGHATGFYTWEYLKELGYKKDKIWQTYLDNLKELKLKRDI